MGAIDFITTGDSDTLKAKKGLLLSPLDAIDAMDMNDTIESSDVRASDDPSVKELETTCNEWRTGKVKPHWYLFGGAKPGTSMLACFDSFVSSNIP